MSYTFAIGDIHGCFSEMDRMLHRISSYASGGTIVFLGDYVDRGPKSRDVIARLIEGPKLPNWKWIALKGNHEDMMVRAYDDRGLRSWWLGNGGDRTEVSYMRERGIVSSEHLEWAAQLPLKYTDEHRIYVHAGMDDSTPYDEQTEEEMLWSRKPPHFSGEYWGKHLVHGHTPSAANPQTTGNRTNIDSACVFGGKLSCAVFDDDIPGCPIEFIEVRP